MKEKSLITLTAIYFHRKGYAVEANVAFEGLSGLLQSFDLIIRKDGESHPVIVKDWRRTVGIDMIIKADKASEDAKLSRPVFVAKKFSDHAKAYSNRKRIILLTEQKLRSSLAFR